jgi:hypothetical protein
VPTEIRTGNYPNPSQKPEPNSLAERKKKGGEQMKKDGRTDGRKRRKIKD